MVCPNIAESPLKFSFITDSLTLSKNADTDENVLKVLRRQE